MVTVFRELRSGVTADGRTSVKIPSGTLSAAEAISVITSGIALSAHFGDGTLRPADVAAGIEGAVIKDPLGDRIAWTEYLEVVVRDRPEWAEFYEACRDAGVTAPSVAEDTALEIFGIRHHGPGSARSLVAALGVFEPDVVLIEGPADADPLIPWAASARTIPPVALLAYVADQPSRAAFWPFAVFSPEWQALTWAAQHDVAVAFCDLPAAATLAGGATPTRPRCRRADGADGSRPASVGPSGRTRWRGWPRRPGTTTPSAGGTT